MDGFCAADVGTYTRRRKNFLLSKKNLPDRGEERRRERLSSIAHNPGLTLVFLPTRYRISRCCLMMEKNPRERYMFLSFALNEQKEEQQKQQPPAADALWRAATKTNRRKKGTGNRVTSWAAK